VVQKLVVGPGVAPCDQGVNPSQEIIDTELSVEPVATP
jgi:hypothetical protein